MSEDIVERLRAAGKWVLPFDKYDPPRQWVSDALSAKAADEIRRLRAECESWKREAEHHAALNRGGNDER